MLRAIIAGLLALGVAAQVVRLAAVNAFARHDPATAALFWNDHPGVQLSLGMVEIAAATREGKRVGQAVTDSIFAVSAKAPLAEEPFLVRGVQAHMAGDRDLAGKAFEAAMMRDARSLPARYFLADHYLRQGDARRGLVEIGALARLAPGGVESLAPYVAQYARQGRNAAQIRSLLRSEPRLEDATLSDLANDPRNANLVLGLANRDRWSGSSEWLPRLLTNIAAAGDYRKARQVWAEVSNVRLDRGALLYDPGFEQGDPPPPFNWTLTSSAVGLSERLPGGGLHVIYYGREDGVLASQLLVLPAGEFRLAMRAAGDVAGAEPLRWRLVCAQSGSEIDSASLREAASGAGWTFVVPTGCAGQRLELFGSSGDLPEQTEVTIRMVSVTAAGRG